MPAVPPPAALVEQAITEGRSMPAWDSAFQEHLRCLGEGYMYLRGELDELRTKYALLTLQHEQQCAALQLHSVAGSAEEPTSPLAAAASRAVSATSSTEATGASRPAGGAAGATKSDAVGAGGGFNMPGAVPMSTARSDDFAITQLDISESAGQDSQEKLDKLLADAIAQGQNTAPNAQAVNSVERMNKLRPTPLVMAAAGSQVPAGSVVAVEGGFGDMADLRTKIASNSLTQANEIAQLSSAGSPIRLSTPRTSGVFPSTDDYSPWRSHHSDVMCPIQAELITAGIQLHPEWVEALDRRANNNASMLRRGSGGVGGSMAGDSMVLRSGDQLISTGIWAYLMAAPSSVRKIFWDFCSFFMLGYDIMMIPMSAFAMPEDDYLKAIDLMITIFWTCDIVINFFTGFYDKGILELRPRPVARRYIKSWFVPDVAIVSSDWFVIALEVASRAERQEEGGNSAGGSVLGMVRIGKSVRILRVLRMFRLLRILKVVQLLEDISDLFHSESLHTCFNVIKLVVAIAVVNHFIACGWFAVGNVDSEMNDTKSSWVNQLRLHMLATNDVELTLGYKYTTSLHWSLTQFTPASMEVFPRNSAERIYTIIVILLALVMFSSFISSITSSMTHLRALREQQRKQQENVRKYIADNKLSMDLSNRIQAFIRQNTRSSSRVRVHASDIPVFKFLPENLSLQMHCEVFFPTLTKHPFFEAMNQGDETGLAKVCHTAISESAVLVGEELFSFGQKANAMFIVVAGNMEYHDGGGQKLPQSVKAGRRICEVALWAAWEHSGRLVGISTADLVMIDATLMRSVIARRRGPTATLCAEYAAQYMRRMLRVCDGLDNLSDIWDDAPYLDDILQDALSRDEQLHLADAYPMRSKTHKHSLMSFASMYELAQHASPIVPRASTQ